MAEKKEKVLKACRNCRALTTADVCPICGSKDLSTTFAGLAIILNPESEIAKEMKVEASGEFALRVR